MSPSVIEQIRTELVQGVERYERRRRRTVRLLASAAALVAVTSSVVWNAGDGNETVLQVGPTGSGPLAGLQEISAPPPPGRLPGSAVWTGSELLWAGATDDNGTLVTLSLDVKARTWRQLAPPPAGVGEGSATAWTGTELIICCGGAPEGSVTAAYNPASGRWRMLPAAPVSGYASGAWSGDRFVVVTGNGAASLDPTSGEWTTLPSPSQQSSFNKLAARGHQIVVWPSPPSRTVAAGEILDPQRQDWSTLPDPPQSSWPAIPDVTWIGSELVILGGLPGSRSDDSERLVGARYNPDTNTWASLPDPLPEPLSGEGNLGSQVSLWTGQDLLVHAFDLASGASSEGVLLAYDPAKDSWRLVGKTSATALTPLAMAGDRVLLEQEDGGRFYLSEPSWRPAEGSALSAATSAVCPGAQHPWQLGPTSDQESGDGLPPSGSATRDLAERVLREQGAALVNQYGASSLSVRVEDGRAWTRRNGSVEIVEAPIATIVITLPNEQSCPAVPAFGPDGVPLTFEVRTG